MGTTSRDHLLNEKYLYHRQDNERNDYILVDENISFGRINLVGMGIGDGWMSPYHNARYANQLYQVETGL